MRIISLLAFIFVISCDTVLDTKPNSRNDLQDKHFNYSVSGTKLPLGQHYVTGSIANESGIKTGRVRFTFSLYENDALLHSFVHTDEFDIGERKNIWYTVSLPDHSRTITEVRITLIKV